MYQPLAIRALVVIAASTLLAGCASHTAKRAENGIKAVPIENKEEALSAGYMGRYLMSTKHRQRFLSKHGEELARIAPGDTNTALGILGASAMGEDLLSMEGVNTVASISLALDVIDWLGPDGSLPFISSAYLPEKVRDISLESAEQARAFMKDYMLTKFEEYADETSRTMECVAHCDSYTPTLSLATTANTPAELSTPEKMYFNLYIWPFMEAKEDPIRDRILGYKPKWASRHQNGIAIFGAVEIGGEDKTIEGLGTVRKLNGTFGKSITYTTPAAMLLLKTLSEDGVWTYGSSFAGADIIAWRGRLYEANNIKPEEFIIKRYELE